MRWRGGKSERREWSALEKEKRKDARASVASRHAFISGKGALL